MCSLRRRPQVLGRGYLVDKIRLLWVHDIVEAAADKFAIGRSDMDIKPPVQLQRATSALSITSYYSAPKSTETITNLIMKMLFTNLVPIATVEHEGLKKCLKFLARTYTVSALKSITSRVKPRKGTAFQAYRSFWKRSGTWSITDDGSVDINRY